jgi:hypothetical protein
VLASLFHALVMVGLGAGWVLIGYALLPRRLREEDPWIVGATSLALGAGAVAVALTGLLVLHVLSGKVAVGVAIVTTLGGVFAARGAFRGRAPSGVRLDGRPARAAAALGVIILTLTLVATLAPPSSMDATVYHLLVPKEFLLNRNWGSLGSLHTFQPFYVEMLFGEGMAIGGGAQGALVHWVLGLGAVAVAGAWGRRLGGSALAAAIIFGATGLFVWESTSGFIDLGLALFSSLALYWAARTERDPALTVLAGVFAGLAAGSKFTGLIAAGLVGCAALAAAWPDWRRGAGRLFAIGAITLAIAAPWYVRNWQLTGNPIYPLANPLFGGPPIVFSGMTYGYGKGVLRLLASPFDLLVRGDAFDQGWSIGPAHLALVPLGLVAARKSRAAIIVGGAFALWWAVWFYSSPQTRLLLPFLPAAAGLAAVGLNVAWTSGRRPLQLAAAAVVGIAVVEGLAAAALFAAISAKATVGLESPSSLLGRMSWGYPAYEAANERLPTDARVAVQGADNLYYLDRYARHVDESLSAEELRRQGFSHLLMMGDCPLAPSAAPARVAWEGSFPLRASRLMGGTRKQECARIEALAAPNR